MTNCLQLLSLTVSAGDPSLRMQKHVDDKQSSESGRGFGLNEADEDAVVDVLDAKADHAVAVLAESHLSQTSLNLCLFHANRARRGSHRSSLTHRAIWISRHGGSGGLICRQVHAHVLSQCWVQA